MMTMAMTDAHTQLIEDDGALSASLEPKRSRSQEHRGLCDLPEETIASILSFVVQLSPTSREALDTLSAFFSVNGFFAWRFLDSANAVHRFMVQALLHRHSNEVVYSIRLFSNQPTARKNSSSRAMTYSVSTSDNEADQGPIADQAGCSQAEAELHLLMPGLLKKVQATGKTALTKVSTKVMSGRPTFFATLRWLEKFNGVRRKRQPTLCWGVASAQSASETSHTFSYSNTYLVCHTTLNELVAVTASICANGTGLLHESLNSRVVVVGPTERDARSAAPGVEIWSFDQWVRYRSQASADPFFALAIHSSAARCFAESEVVPSTIAQNVLLGMTPTMAQVRNAVQTVVPKKKILWSLN